MKLAVISDTHFGDPACGLVDAHGKTTDKYLSFREAAGIDNDYLVLLGDIFDFSVAHYRDAFVSARVFFDAVRGDRIARDIVYVPGNHDGDFWHLLQYEVTVIKRIRGGETPVPLRHSVPAVIDDRDGSPGRGLWLPTAGIEAAHERARAGRDGVFLDRMFSNPSGSDPKFWVAYPNLYLVTKDGDSVLLTHGHYFESYWAAGSQLALGVAPEEIATELARSGAAVAIAEGYGAYAPVEPTVGMNFPLNQLSCSGIGQAGPLTAVIRSVQNAVKRHEPATVTRIYDRLQPALAKLLRLGWVQRRLLGLGLGLLGRPLKAKLSEYKDVRDDPELLTSAAFVEAFGRFFLASLAELEAVNALAPYEKLPVPPPSQVIFGHTHGPIPFGLESCPAPELGSSRGRRAIPIANTGGWLQNPVTGKVSGAVVRYETARGLSATLIY